MTEATTAAVRRQIVVDAPIDHAFTTFVDRFGDFKPREHNLLGSPIDKTVFEPRVGGHIYDRGVDGSVCRWARVLAYEPPHRVVFSWDIGPQWQIETNADNASEVEVRWIAETPRRTRVELEHRNLDRHGPGWGAVRDGVANDAGWPLYLARYAALVAEAADVSRSAPEAGSNVMAMARAERADLADLLETLRPEQWEVPSLCAGWRVHDVVAHVVSYEEHDRADLAKRLVRARFRPHRLNDVALAEYAHWSHEALLKFLRSHLEPRGATARFGGGVGLVDGLIHQQDIRRALGLPRSVPAERLLYALPFAVTAPPLRGFWIARGVRLVTTDLDWTRGRGPEARGPAEAVLMTMAGRGAAASELDGSGADILRRRLERRATGRSRSDT